MLERDPRQLAAQPLDLEMLEILHPLAKLADRAAQQTQRFGMVGQEIGVPAEIGEDIAAADLSRDLGRIRGGPPAFCRADGQPRPATSTPGGNGRRHLGRIRAALSKNHELTHRPTNIRQRAGIGRSVALPGGAANSAVGEPDRQVSRSDV